MRNCESQNNTKKKIKYSNKFLTNQSLQKKENNKQIFVADYCLCVSYLKLSSRSNDRWPISPFLTFFFESRGCSKLSKQRPRTTRWGWTVSVKTPKFSHFKSHDWFFFLFFFLFLFLFLVLRLLERRVAGSRSCGKSLSRISCICVVLL